MIDMNGNADLEPQAAAGARPGIAFAGKVTHRFRVEAFNARGEPLWVEEFNNLVTTAGKNAYLDARLKTGLASPSHFVGLVDGGSAPTFVAADTMASHAGWTENVGYSQGTRVAWTPGTISAGSVDNSGSVATFSINATVTLAGAFLVDNSTKSGTTGTLMGEGSFSANRSLANGDTITVTITASIA